MKRIRLLLGVLLAGTAGLVACGDDESPSTPTPTPTPTPPSAPTGVAATVSADGVTVTWSGGSNATSFQVQLSTTGDVLEQTAQGGATSATFTGLAPGATYCPTVIAVNADGQAQAAGGCAMLPEEEERLVQVSADVLTDETWTSDKVYMLMQPVFVGRDCGPNGGKEGCAAVTLTIEPGTTVLGNADVPQGIRGSYLVVTRGSQLIADANANQADKSAKPNPEDVIVFTSSKPRGSRARGDWGGLVINGQAPTNVGDEAQGEGDSGFFGGPEDHDSSGILRGVRIEFAGDDVTESDQLNGIAFQGVGAGTTVDYVQVHYNVDDGTEPFGGSVSQTHMVLTGVGDDSFDGTDGYRGFIQFGIVQQRSDDADQGFELSNNGSDEDAEPRSMAVVANVTTLGANVPQGSGEISIGGESDVGLLLREGSYWKVYNTIITGFDDGGVCVENPQTVLNADARLGGNDDPAMTLDYQGLVLWSNGGEEGGAEETNLECSKYDNNAAFFNRAGANNVIADPMLPDAAFNIGSRMSPPDMIPSQAPGGYTAAAMADWMTGGLVMPQDGRELVATDYAGAVEPGTSLSDAWYTGWTVWTVDGSDSRPGASEL